MTILASINCVFLSCLYTHKGYNINFTNIMRVLNRLVCNHVEIFFMANEIVGFDGLKKFR